MTALTDADRALLAEAKRLAEAATPGPWKIDPIFPTMVSLLDGQPIASIDRARDGALIAASRTAVPALVALAERLAAEVERLSGPPTEEMVEAAAKAGVETSGQLLGEGISWERRAAEYPTEASEVRTVFRAALTAALAARRQS